MIGVPFSWLGFLARRFRTALLLLWCAPLAVGSIAGLLFETYASKRENVNKLLDGLPFIRKLMDAETLDFLSPEGFFNVAFQHPLTLLVFALTAGIPALTSPAADRGRGVLDLVLAGPTHRRSITRATAVVGIVGAACAGVAPLLGAYLGAALAGRADALPFGRYAIVALNAASFVAALHGVALVVSAAAPDAARGIARYAAFFIASMLIDALSRLWEAGAAIRWATLGGYYRPTEVIAGTADLPPRFAVLLGVAAFGIVVSDVVMDRRRRA